MFFNIERILRIIKCLAERQIPIVIANDSKGRRYGFFSLKVRETMPPLIYSQNCQIVNLALSPYCLKLVLKPGRKLHLTPG